MRENISTFLLLLTNHGESHEKGAYLGEIKSEMRGSGPGLGKGDDHGQEGSGGEEGLVDSQARS